MTLKIERMHEDAIIPTYAHEGDAGMDLYSIGEYIIESGSFCLVSTGIKIELPKGTEAQIRPRSGLALKHGITVLNSPGTIDEGYRGEIGVILMNHGESSFAIAKHMRIAQMVISPVLRAKIEEVYISVESERGQGGYGSSGD